MGSIKGIKSVKVELSLIEDLRKSLDATFKFSTEFATSALEVDNWKKKALSNFKSFESSVNEAKKNYDATSKASSNLGVEIPSNVSSLYSEMLKAYQEDKSQLSKL
jgi:predicted  nucleic acid-binding Zn-ribbon protein